jgi:hypothetical protein
MRRAPDQTPPAWLVAWGQRSSIAFPELVGPATKKKKTLKTSPPFFSPGNTARYSSVADCFAQTWREGGPRAFYKGFTSNFARLGAWNSAMFVLLEQARAVMRDL